MAQCVVCSTDIRDDARFCPSCGAEQPRAEVAGTDADPLMGKIVARKFKVEKLLGVGGMGKVYKARQLSLDKAVVVKVLHDHFREDPQLVQRFQREAKAASRLNHPNSIQIIDFGQDDGGIVFMAMEYLQGQDLFAVLKKEGPLSAERLGKVMVQVCSALAEAHEQNVIHRDLKPENIMVEDRRGQRDFVKVLDFGIAKLQDPGEGQQALTQAGMVCGTPEYMSPEQARGLQLDARSDIYALGVVMYQLAVGELPFIAETPIGIVTKHILEKPVPPRQRAPQLNIPEELERIILKAMEKDVDQRFSSVSELGEALENLLRALNASPNSFSSRGDGSGSFPVPRTDSSVAKRSTADAAGPTAASPPSSGSPHVATSPTVVRAEAHGAALGPAPAHEPAHGVAHDRANDPPNRDTPAPAGRGTKAAAIVVLALLVLGGAAFAARQALAPKESVVDAGMAAVTTSPPGADSGVRTFSDAGVRADANVDSSATVDAGNSPVAVAVADAGPTAPAADAGARAASDAPDAGPRTAVKGDGGQKPDAAPPRGNRAAAEKAFKEGHQKYLADDCDKAMPFFSKANQLDPTFADPARDIAYCQKKNGRTDLACAAANEYVKRKGLSDANASNILAVFCN